MHLTNVVQRLTNHIKFHHIPGDILIGKHRVWPKLNKKNEKYMLRQIDQEVDNMKLISRPYVCSEMSQIVVKEIEADRKQVADEAKREKIRANKNKIQNRLMSDFLEPLRNHRVWE